MNKNSILFLLAGLLVSCVLTSPFVLDFTLTPRFVALSLTLILVLLASFKAGEAIAVKIDAIAFVYLAWVVWNCFLVFIAKNTAEALFSVSKEILAFGVFMAVGSCLKKDPQFFISYLLKGSVVLFFIAFLPGLIEIGGIRSLQKDLSYAVTGINGHKNLYSSFLFLNLFFLVFAFQKLESTWKKLSVLAIVLDLLMLLFLRTKAVWMGLVLSAFIFGVLWLYNRYRKKEFRFNFFIILGIKLVAFNLFFLFLLQPLIKKGITKGQDAADLTNLDQERLTLWDKTYHMINGHPVVGVGPGNWQVHFPEATLSGLWRAEDLNFTFQRPHNDFLWILSETGIIGLNIFLIIVLSILMLLFRSISKTDPTTEDNKIMRLAFVFICGYFLISFFDFPAERIEHTILINVIFAISCFYIFSNNVIYHFSTSVEKKLVYTPITILFFIFIIGMCRYRGEYHTKKMYDHRNENNLVDEIKAGRSAMSFAYTLDPTSVPLYWYIGNANAAMENFEKARQDFLKAMEYNPYNRNVINDLASSYVYTNETSKAITLYKECARISPRFDDPKLNLASIYLKQKQYDTAAVWLKSIMHDSERRSMYEKMVEMRP